jgi:cyclopropane fatty-acyl-phospholipid synthase-like methyltransferase
MDITHAPQIAAKNLLHDCRFPNSAKYWEHRYDRGGNSGEGSYNRLAKFKADIINNFVSNHDIHSILEYGCGDGNQLMYMKYPTYIGLDISKSAVSRCIEKFKHDSSKSFYIHYPQTYPQKPFFGDLTLSLDVIYHLIEDDIYKKHIDDLFNTSNQYVVIYSSNFESPRTQHVRHRFFSNYIRNYHKNFNVIRMIPNIYPYDKNTSNTSLSNFYIFSKVSR